MVTKNTEITELIADVREQVLYLQELGVDSLEVQISDKPVKIEALAVDDSTTPAYVPPLRAVEIPTQKPGRPVGSRLAALPKLNVPPIPTAAKDKASVEIAPTLPEP